MTNQHPIHPPIELVQELWDRLRKAPDSSVDAAIAWTEAVALAAQWGADQELEACCEWLASRDLRTQSAAPCLLRAARRPKPPSLKEQALADFKWLIGRTVGNPEADARSERILQALESLSDD
jgi:hypothetical protein